MYMMDKTYTVFELANLLQVDRRTVSKLIKTGKILAMNIGMGKKRSHWRVHDCQLQRFLAESYEKNNKDEE